MVQNGFAFKSELFTHSEGKPLIRIRDIEDGWTENFYSGEYSDEFVVRKGDILIGMDGDFNAAIWQGVDGLLNQRVCRLIPSTKNFSDKFLFLCLQPYLNAINAETSSVTVKHLSSRTIGEIPLPLPPRNEQHRIVAKIEELFSELDKGIENLKTAQAQLKVYRQALLKHAFEGKLTAQWRAERSVIPAKAGIQPLNGIDSRLRGNDEHLETAAALQARIQQERAQRYQQQLADWEATGKQGSKPKSPKPLPPLTADELAELPELPEGWVGARLGWMTCSVEYGTSAKSSESGACPVLRMGNIQNGKFDWADLVFTSDEDEIEKYLLREGDVLFNRTNSPELVGKTAIFKSNQQAIFAGYLIRVNQIDTIVESRYLNYFLNSHIAKQHGNTVKTDGVNQSNINGDKLVNYPFPFCSLKEQNEIVELLDSQLSEVDQLDQTITTSLQQAEALRQSILKKAFSGQLVPQDPHDEPASVLLARIKAEKIQPTEKSKKSISRSKRNE